MLIRKYVLIIINKMEDIRIKYIVVISVLCLKRQNHYGKRALSVYIIYFFRIPVENICILENMSNMFNIPELIEHFKCRVLGTRNTKYKMQSSCKVVSSIMFPAFPDITTISNIFETFYINQFYNLQLTKLHLIFDINLKMIKSPWSLERKNCQTSESKGLEMTELAVSGRN